LNCLYSHFSGGLGKTIFLQECVSAVHVQGHPRLLILESIESVYATSY